MYDSQYIIVTRHKELTNQALAGLSAGFYFHYSATNTAFSRKAHQAECGIFSLLTIIILIDPPGAIHAILELA